VANGLSQETLAELSDLHRTYISAVESGKRNLTLESIQRLATALGATVGSFFNSVESSGEPGGSKELLPLESATAGGIMLVEDDPHDAEYTLAAFKAVRLANPVWVATDGAAALDYLLGPRSRVKNEKRELPQLLLLDLRLPKVHGLEVLRRLKADRRTEKIPVIVLSASRSDADIAEAMRLGANAYLIKPVDFHRLAEVTPKLKFRWALL
jgi:CheY-like chemotaxis protein/DNA-binding XRE family transcriptional regulator